MSRDITSAGSLSTEWLEVRNAGDYPLPPYSACEIVRSKRKDGRILYSVQRVTQDGWREAVLITGPTQLEPGDYGVAARGPVLYCAVDPSGDPPQVDEEWGPADGKTWLVQGTTGGKVTLEQTESGYVHVWRDAAGAESINPTIILYGSLRSELAPNTIAEMNVTMGAPSYDKAIEFVSEDGDGKYVELSNLLGMFAGTSSPIVSVMVTDSSGVRSFIPIANGCPPEEV